MDKKKDKNNVLFKQIKIIFLCLVVTISFIYTIKILDKVNLQVDDLFLTTLVSSSNNIKKEGLNSNLVEYVAKLDLFNPLDLLKTNYQGLVDIKNYTNNIDKDELNAVVKEEQEKEPTLETVKKAPIVYIYNTHPSEEYSTNNLLVHSIKPNVLTASYMLEEKLKEYGINSIVEETDITEILTFNNWNYASSYAVTKMLMEQAKKNNPSLIYFIDLHRDSVTKDKTTVTINGKSYAKVLFLLGLENPKYQESKVVISRLNEIISTKYKGISKGIYEKGGAGVNGVYNQDFSSRCVLIEVGGFENTLEEVSNTINAIGEMLNIYIGEDHG